MVTEGLSYVPSVIKGMHHIFLKNVLLISFGCVYTYFKMKSQVYLVHVSFLHTFTHTHTERERDINLLPIQMTYISQKIPMEFNQKA